jgi:hypothetical protein
MNNLQKLNQLYGYVAAIKTLADVAKTNTSKGIKEMPELIHIDRDIYQMIDRIENTLFHLDDFISQYTKKP